MKNKLDKEEVELLESIEKGEWQPVKNQEREIRKHMDYALTSLKKDKRINIRISSRDLELLQIKALEEGLPYQTLISSVLHKYINSVNA
ncbi:antitoxin [Bacteroidetes/Chlorobi group bacterium ChocPot_Mid]|jgi:predicted DNA binding CopG/RHH family protein|nr:MAG: antitoxin [Bacteroidetes/Chlorobi group bacterium ChocPot_Mid]